MTEQTGQSIDAVSDQLATFIVDDLGWEGAKEDLLSADPVVLSGILDSSDLLELAGFLEDKFGVTIDDEEIVAETFASVRMLAELVVAKLASTPAP